MDVLKTTALLLALIFISNALPISKSNSSEDLMEDEWRTLQPCDKRSHLDGTDMIWFVQENVRTGELRYPHGKPGGGRHRRDVVSDTSRLWPNGIVYYSINDNIQGQGWKVNTVLDAMRHWENKTCLRFKERTTESAYIDITGDGSCCCSFVGYTGYKQPLVLGLNDCFTFSTIVHEIGHAIGFYHEQSRHDRDDYVIIHWDNIKQYKGGNFRKLNKDEATTLGLPYDVHSVMHYDEDAFAKAEGLKTITVKGGQSVYNDELSPIDVLQARKLYSCSDPSSDPPKSVPPHSTRPPAGPPSGCYHMVSGMSGVITSQGYPNHYPSGDCTWSINGPEGYRGQITFQELDLDSSPKCGDKVEVHALGWMIGTSCPAFEGPFNLGIKLGESINMGRNLGEIVLKADGLRGNGKGFKASYRFEDINECSNKALNSCPHKCVNTPGSFHCECPKGYYIPERDPYKCLDIQECAYDNGGCSDICWNTLGSYECRCPPNKVLSADKKTCISSTECRECSHDCNITSHGVECVCPKGMGLDATGKKCIVTDRCMLGNHGCQHKCINIGSQGDYRCECNDGYSLASDGKTCQDVDECQDSRIVHLCSPNRCVNTEGSFSCECEEGFEEVRRIGNLLICNDVNECDDRPCDQKCTNTRGSFTCGCGAGYRLNDDGRTCSDINECETTSHGCQGACVNTIGSYKCTCPAGYVSNSAGICEDVNECLGNHGCDQVCRNTPGSYVCSCEKGYTMSGSVCKDIDECAENTDSCSDVCVNTKGSYKCQCSVGYTLGSDGTTCNDINECEVGDNPCSSGICANTEGSYSCQGPGGDTGSSSHQCSPGSTIKLSNSERFQIPGGVRECRQQVTSREGKVIKVDLSSVSLPSSSNCENYIEVLNGDSPDSVVILKYCGGGIATAVSSTPNVIITWHFENTSGNASPGDVVLSEQHQQAIPNSRCGVVPVTTPNGVEFANNYFPRLNQRSGNCLWLLHTSPNKKLDITFKYFDIRSPSGDCKDNYLEIKDGYSFTSPVLKKICSPSKEIHVVSSGYAVLINMKVTDASTMWRGIHAVAKYI